MHFYIKKPIWKTRSIGLDEVKLDQENLVEILYKNMDGRRLYPSIYSISREKALKYPVQIWRGIKLHIIPIENLNTYEKETLKRFI